MFGQNGLVPKLERPSTNQELRNHVGLEAPRKAQERFLRAFLSFLSSHPSPHTRDHHLATAAAGADASHLSRASPPPSFFPFFLAPRDFVPLSQPRPSLWLLVSFQFEIRARLFSSSERFSLLNQSHQGGDLHKFHHLDTPLIPESSREKRRWCSGRWWSGRQAAARPPTATACPSSSPSSEGTQSPPPRSEIHYKLLSWLQVLVCVCVCSNTCLAFCSVQCSNVYSGKALFWCLE